MQPFLIGPGVAAMGLGVWLLWVGRGADRSLPPTRVAVALSLLVGGWYLLNYGLPAGSWSALRVPPDRLWVLILGIIAMVAVSAALDRWEQEEEEAQAGPGAGGEDRRE